MPKSRRSGAKHRRTGSSSNKKKGLCFFWCTPAAGGTAVRDGAPGRQGHARDVRSGLRATQAACCTRAGAASPEQRLASSRRRRPGLSWRDGRTGTGTCWQRPRSRPTTAARAPKKTAARPVWQPGGAGGPPQASIQKTEGPCNQLIGSDLPKEALWAPDVPHGPPETFAALGLPRPVTN